LSQTEEKYLELKILEILERNKKKLNPQASQEGNSEVTKNQEYIDSEYKTVELESFAQHDQHLSQQLSLGG